MIDIDTEKLFLVRNLHKSKKYAEAFKENEKFLRSQKYSQEAWYRRGLLIQQLLMQEAELDLTLDDSLKCFEIASRLSLTSGHPFLESGYYHYTHSSKMDEALDKFAQAEEFALYLLKESLIGKVKCFMDMENYESASAVLQAAQSIFDDDLDFKILSDELRDIKA